MKFRQVILNTLVLVPAGLGVVAAALFDRVTLDSLWLSFLGGFHPVLLHLPIGVVTALAFRAFLPRQSGNGSWLWWLAALSSTAALATGYLLGAEGGYDAVLLDRHLWAAVVFSGLCWGGLWAVRTERRQLVTNSILGLTLGAMTVAGHYGGVMVHGDPLAAAPWNLDPDRYATLPPFPAEVKVYNDLVVPILGAKCVSCHGPVKQKGRLRLDDLAAIQRGGHAGPVLVAGSITDSELLKVIQLPVRSDDHMPPVGHPQVSPVELAALSYWIAQGANESIAISRDQPPVAFTALLAPGYRLLPDAAAEKARLAAEAATTAQRQSRRAQLQAAVAQLPPDLAPLFYFPDLESADLIFNAIGHPSLSIAETATCRDLLLECHEINLANFDGAPDLLPALAQSSRLVRLDLRHTPTTAADFAALARAPQLEFLNLYGTAIKELPPLPPASFPQLQKLFVGRTALSAADVASLTHLLPHCDIIGDLTLEPTSS